MRDQAKADKNIGVFCASSFTTRWPRRRLRFLRPTRMLPTPAGCEPFPGAVDCPRLATETGTGADSPRFDSAGETVVWIGLLISQATTNCNLTRQLKYTTLFRPNKFAAPMTPRRNPTPQSLVPQRFDRIERRGATCGVKSENHSDRDGDAKGQRDRPVHDRRLQIAHHDGQIPHGAGK